MTDDRGASARITDEVTSWEGVHAEVGSRGEWSFRLGRREIGHLHGDRVAHFAFPRAVRAELLEAGRIEPHPVASPGLGARPIRGAEDERDVLALLRLNYDRMTRSAAGSSERWTASPSGP